MAATKGQLAILGGLAALPLIGLGVIFLQPKHALTALDAECTNDVFCDSSQCLHRATGSGDVSPQAPGVCTTACKVDSDCPTTMRCGGVTIRQLFPGVGRNDTRDPGLRCIPNAWD